MSTTTTTTATRAAPAAPAQMVLKTMSEEDAVAMRGMAHQGRALPGIPVFATHAETRQWRLEHMAAAFRVFAREGYAEGISGHISVRDPEFPDRFWINPLGVHFAMMRASDMICVSHETGEVLAGNVAGSINSAGFQIHSSVHRARPCFHSATIQSSFCVLSPTTASATAPALRFFFSHHKPPSTSSLQNVQSGILQPGPSPALRRPAAPAGLPPIPSPGIRPATRLLPAPGRHAVPAGASSPEAGRRRRLSQGLLGRRAVLLCLRRVHGLLSRLLSAVLSGRPGPVAKQERTGGGRKTSVPRTSAVCIGFAWPERTVSDAPLRRWLAASSRAHRLLCSATTTRNRTARPVGEEEARPPRRPRQAPADGLPDK